MSRAIAVFALATVVVGLLGLAKPASSAPWDNKPKILLHLMPSTMKNACTTYGNLSDCTQAITRGTVGTASGPFYFMYLLVANGPFRDPGVGGVPSGNGLGIAGMQCGIRYTSDGSGFQVFSWNLCATMEFAEPGWPASGTGNLITWDSTTRCQKGEVSIAGYIYCASYGADRVQLTARPVDNLAKIADCQAQEHYLSNDDLGWVVFSQAGDAQGFNPCCPFSCGSSPTVDLAVPPPPAVTPQCNGVALAWDAVSTGSLTPNTYLISRDGGFLVQLSTTSFLDSSAGTEQHCYQLTVAQDFHRSPPSVAVCSRSRTSPSPSSVEPAGAAPGTTVEIHGSNFGEQDDDHSAVKFSGSAGQLLAASILEWQDSVIRCVVPEGATSGVVTVVNLCNQSATLGFTPVVVSNLLATLVDAGIELVWDAADDGSAVGFNLYRRATTGERVRLNDGPLPVAAHNRFSDDGLVSPGRYVYSIDEVRRAGGTGLLAELTVEYAGRLNPPGITAILPNPARGNALISYSVATDAPIRLDIFDIQGRRVATLVDGHVAQGPHTVTWDGRSGSGRAATPGMYVVRLSGAGLEASEKLILSR